MKEQMMDYLAMNTGALTMQDVLLNFLTAAVIGAVIYLSYRLSHSGAAYSARFNVSMVMLTLVTTLVMNVIGNNIALSLGMVGAQLALTDFVNKLRCCRRGVLHT